MSSRFLPLAAIPPVVALAIGLAPLPLAAQQRPTPTVTTLTAEATDFTLTTRLPGRIKASTTAEVRPQVSGIIRERLFVEGGMVQAGQPLYRIEADTYEAAVAAARAGVAQAKANHDLTLIDAARAEQLLSTNTGSASTRDTAVANRDAAAAGLQVAEAQLASAEIDLDRTTIRAPISGVIGLSQTSTGALVSAAQTTPLATIRALDPVYVDVTQSANDLLRWGATAEAREHLRTAVATMTLPTGDTFGPKGALEAAEPQVEPTTGMVTLRISFPNPDFLLLPGLYVEVDMPQATEKGAILVPQSALMRNAAGASHVWGVEDGKVAAREVTVLGASGTEWVTSAGLKPGDAIITSGFQKIAVGAAVEIAPAEAPAASGAAAQTGGN